MEKTEDELLEYYRESWEKQRKNRRDCDGISRVCDDDADGRCNSFK